MCVCHRRSCNIEFLFETNRIRNFSALERLERAALEPVQLTVNRNTKPDNDANE